MEWPRWIRATFARIVVIVSPRRAERDLDDELSFHFAMQEHANRADGLTDADARRGARLALGGLEQTKEASRDVRPLRWARDLAQDVRYALRGLRRSPIFTVVAIVTLALGIGASAALFSVADPLLTRPLPVRAPEELVLFRTVGSPAWPEAEALVPSTLSERIGPQSASFAGAFWWVDEAIGMGRARVLAAPGEPLGPFARTMLVSGSFFDTLGVQPAMGRLFSALDDDPAVEPRAVISHAFWQMRYGGDPEVVGASLALDPPGAGEPFTATIIGVAQRRFYGVDLDFVPDVWVPARPVREAMFPGRREMFAREGRPQVAVGTGGAAHAMARLRPGVSLQQAQAEVDVLAASVFEDLPPRLAAVAAARPRIRVESGATGHSLVRERFRDPVRILMAGVAFVLLMACANVAALMLARAASRQPEIAVRLSLGSGRPAIVKLLLTESLLVGSAGGALAMLVAWWVTRAAPVYLPADFGATAQIGVNGRVLLFTAAVALLSVMVFGLAPALWSARLPLAQAMRDRSGPAARSGSVARLHRFVIPLQVAFAVVLLAGAGLFVQTLWQLRAVETGFDHERIVLFGIDREVRIGWGADTSFASLVIPPELIDRLAGLPGVESIASFTTFDAFQTDSVPADDEPERENGDPARHYVQPRFFETMGIRIMAGRVFAEREHVPSTTSPAIVSASLARHLFGRPEAALGQYIDTRHEIVGVADDVTQRSLRESRARTVYTPITPTVTVGSTIVLRTRGKPAQITRAVRAAVREFDPRFDVRDLRTFEDIRDAWTVRERGLAHVSAVFGVLATLLAAIGIGGVVAYTAARRTPEIGLRMALGARVPQVVAAVSGRLLGIVAGGVGLGLFGVAAFAPLVARQLFGVAPLDPLAVGGAMLIVLASGGLAAYVPASLAARRIDPIAVLKHE